MSRGVKALKSSGFRRAIRAKSKNVLFEPVWSDKVERWARYCFQIGFRFERTIVPTHASPIPASIHLHYARARVIRSMFVFLLSTSISLLSFLLFSSFFFSVLRFGSSRWSIKRLIDPLSSIRFTRSQSLTEEGGREGGTERYIVESRLSPRIFCLDDLEPPPLRDLSELTTWDWISRIRVNDKR